MRELNFQSSYWFMANEAITKDNRVCCWNAKQDELRGTRGYFRFRSKNKYTVHPSTAVVWFVMFLWHFVGFQHFPSNFSKTLSDSFAFGITIRVATKRLTMNYPSILTLRSLFYFFLNVIHLYFYYSLNIFLIC